MIIDPQKLEKLKIAHAKIEEGLQEAKRSKMQVSVKEVKELFDLVIKMITMMKKQLEEEIKENGDNCEKKVDNLLKDFTVLVGKTQEVYDLIDNTKTKASNEIENVKKTVLKEVARVENKIPVVQDHTADIGYLEDLIKKVEQKIPTIKEETPEETITKVNKAFTKINRERVEGLEEELKRIESIKSTQGGGVSNLRIQQAFKYILKTETPVGDIDGVNTEYTVSQQIFAVLAFSLNGEVIPQIPNYTIAGNKITFSTALPTDYSGLDFEIKYI
jgi:hypothetical protein